MKISIIFPQVSVKYDSYKFSQFFIILRFFIKTEEKNVKLNFHLRKSQIEKMSIKLKARKMKQ